MSAQTSQLRDEPTSLEVSPTHPTNHSPTKPSPLALDVIPLPVSIVILVSIVLLIGNALWIVLNTAATTDSAAEYARSFEVKRSLNDFQTTMNAAESGQRGYLLTGRVDYLQPFFAAIRNWRTEIEHLRKLKNRLPNEELSLTQLESSMASALQDLERTIAVTDPPGANADLESTARAADEMERLRGVLARMVALEDQRIDRLRAEVLRDMWVTAGVALLTAIITICVLVGLNKLLQRYVSARGSAERALREANEQLNRLVEERTIELTDLSQHLIRVTEEEKAKLARELHDTLGSNLTAINMDVSRVLKRLPEQFGDLRERLQRALDMLAATVELKRAVIEGLRPSHLDSLGLGYAVRSLCEEYTERAGLPCSTDIGADEDFEHMDPAWSIALYRIAQEGLTNVTKHSQATAIWVLLQKEANGVRLRITDNGVGIPDGALAKPKTHGLAGMRERMRQVGGTLTVSRAPTGRGIVLEAFIPTGAARPEDGQAPLPSAHQADSSAAAVPSAATDFGRREQSPAAVSERSAQGSHS